MEGVLLQNLKEVEEVDKLLDEFEATREKKLLQEVTARMKKVATRLRELTANPECKTKENAPLLQQLSSKMKDLVQRMKQLAGSEQEERGSDSGSAIIGDGSLTRGRRVSLSKPLEGWLKKQGEDMFKGWKTRYFRQNGLKLFYFNSAESSAESQGHIDLSQVTAVVCTSKHQFDITTATRTYHLQSLQRDEEKAHAEVRYWVEALKGWVSTVSSYKEESSRRLSLVEGVVESKGDETDKEIVFLQEKEKAAAFEDKQRKEEENERLIQMDREKKAKEERERKVKEEKERRVKEEMERKAKEEKERKAKEEIERKVKEEKERKAKEDMERKVKEEKERKAKEEMERKVKEEKERKAKEEMERKAKEEKERKLQEEKALQAHMTQEKIEKEKKERKDKLQKEKQERELNDKARIDQRKREKEKGAEKEKENFLEQQKKELEETFRKEIEQVEEQELKDKIQGENPKLIKVTEESQAKNEVQGIQRPGETQSQKKIAYVPLVNSDLTSLSKDEQIQFLLKALQAAEEKIYSNTSNSELYLQLHEELKRKERQYEFLRGKQKLDQEGKKKAEERVDSLRSEIKQKDEELKAKDKHILKLTKKIKKVRKDWISKDVSPPNSAPVYGSSWEMRPELDGKNREIKQLKEAIWAHQNQNAKLEAEILRLEAENKVNMKLKDEVIHSLEKELTFTKETYQKIRDKYLQHHLRQFDTKDQLESSQIELLQKEYFFSLALNCKLNMRDDCNIHTGQLYERAVGEGVDWQDWPDWISTQVAQSTNG